MYELKATPFGNIRNIVVHGTGHVVAHVLCAAGVYSLWEPCALWEGDELLADVASWQHGLHVWEIYATS